MAEWAMAHPWLTFFLVGLALLVVDSVIANICEAVGRHKDKTLPEPPEEGRRMMLLATALLQIIYMILAIKSSADGNAAQTVLFCALMICEEISAQHQKDREEAAHD